MASIFNEFLLLLHLVGQRVELGRRFDFTFAELFLVDNELLMLAVQASQFLLVPDLSHFERLQLSVELIHAKVEKLLDSATDFLSIFFAVVNAKMKTKLLAKRSKIKLIDIILR